MRIIQASVTRLDSALDISSRDHGQGRKGFEIEIYNSRGVHPVDPEGSPKRELAKFYRKKAESIEIEGYS